MAELSPLRRRMIEDMTIRNMSPATQRSYINAVSKFSRYFRRSPERLDLEDVRAFQVHLVSTGISWASLNQIVCALRFFYGVTLGEAEVPERIAYAREPRKLPVVLSADEVVQFLESVSSLKSRAALTTAYAAGLRASEVAGLRVADIDSARGVILVRHGKGAKDRNVMLSQQLLGILRAYWKLARPRTYLFPGRDDDHPIDPTVLLGNWRASRDDGSKFLLTLKPDKTFTWKFSQKDHNEVLNGTYGVEQALLIMQSKQGGAMLGQVTMESGDSFNFKMPGAPPDDPGLNFIR